MSVILSPLPTRIVYINLHHRTDRRVQVEQELCNLGVPADHVTRFPAIHKRDGAVGCALSHLAVLRMALQEGWDDVMIVEDDIWFTDPATFVRQYRACMEKHYHHFDVLMLSGNVIPPVHVMDDTCAQVVHCQTTTGYLVKRHYYETLIRNIQAGIQWLQQCPTERKLYAIDRYWFVLQERHRWLIVTPLTVTQRAGYSDIEQKETNYEDCILDLNKPWLIRNT